MKTYANRYFALGFAAMLAVTSAFVSCTQSEEVMDLSCEYKEMGQYTSIFNIAVDGDAFLGVSDSVETYYTKNGVFAMDAEGCLALPNGMVLQGKINHTIGNVKIPMTTPAKATTRIIMAGNLNAETETGGTFKTVFSIYDNSGEEHILTITFIKVSEIDKWEWNISFEGKEEIVQGSGAGKMSFTQDGTVATWRFDDTSQELKVNPRNGADTMYIDLDVGGPGDFRGITQFASASTANCTHQDGYQMGNLIALTIDEYGLIEGEYSNKTSHIIAQVMLADFANPNGLLEISDGIFAVSKKSGKPSWGKPITESSSILRQKDR